MRWLPAFLSLSLLSVGSAWAAKKSASDRFDSFYAKALTSAAPVKLDDALYKELTSTPRDYSTAVLLTALEARYQCQLCREFQPEWDLLGRSWVKGDKAGESRIVFSTLDFSEGRETFMSLSLQTAPVLLFFPPTVGPHAAASGEALRYDFTAGPQSAEHVHSWISRHLPGRPHPQLQRPIDWMRWFTSIVLLAGSMTAVFVAWPYVLPVIQNRNVWAAISLISILLFTSGHMYNQIRQVPYAAPNGQGGISYMAGGFQNQFGLETQIVAAIYGILSFATISLAVKVPRLTNPRIQGFAVLAWGAILFLVYSFLMMLFRIKNGGYPFSLPPFM